MIVLTANIVADESNVHTFVVVGRVLEGATRLVHPPPPLVDSTIPTDQETVNQLKMLKQLVLS